MNNILDFFFSQFYIPSIGVSDVIEIFLMVAAIYYVLAWIMNTKAYAVLKGMIIILLFAMVAWMLNLRTIIWLAQKTISVGIIALVIIFQPELRRALEQLGRKKIAFDFLNGDKEQAKGGMFSTKTENELIRAAFEMGAVKTGALIVIEKNFHLDEYIKTGIEVDGLLTSQLLINIFEHNTPLHDGAVVVRGDRVVAATCYLPLSDNVNLSKELGTRHRAGVGISEVTDSLTIIVSEETGAVSIAQSGVLQRDVNRETLRKELDALRTSSGMEMRRFSFFSMLRGKNAENKEDRS